MSKGIKKFGTKRYKYTGYEDTKHEAQVHAERIRSRGDLVRVDTCDKGYCIYVHGTKPSSKKEKRAKKHTKILHSLKKRFRLYPYD